MGLLLKSLDDYSGHKLTTIYGEAGTGKSWLGSTMTGKTLFIDADKGLGALKGKIKADVADVNSWEDFLEALELAKKYDSVVIDHLTKLEQFLRDALIDSDPKAKYMSQKLYGYALQEFKMVISDIVALSNSGINVLLLAHEAKKGNAEKGIPERITLDLQEKVGTAILGASRIVGNARKYTKSVQDPKTGEITKKYSYGIQFRDGDEYVLKVAGDNVKERIMNPTWDKIVAMLDTVTQEKPKKKKPTKKEVKEDKGE